MLTFGKSKFVRLPNCRSVGLLIVGILCAGAIARSCVADELPRRISLGVQVQPVSEETQKRLKLRNTRGAEVTMVFPDSTAAQAGIMAGDVILAIAGQSVANTANFVETVGLQRGGKELEIRLNRDGADKVLKVLPKELPQESSDQWEIEYSSVASKAGRLRTVVSLPKNLAKVPIIVLLSGLGNGMCEHPSADPIGFKGLAYKLNELGFGVMRVDKPGCGDSQGGPARDVDFESVVDGYVAGVRAIKQHPRLLKDQVFLVGCSAGGLQAPLVAAQESVRGIAVFGAMSCSWSEFLQNSTRRQMNLSGASAGDIQEQVALQSAGWHYLGYEKMTPDDIAVRRPELTEWVEKNWADGKYFSGISYRFFQQLCQQNIARAWEKFDGHVLALWGESDFVTFADDHQWLADIANKNQAGRGEFRKLAGVDHNLRLSSSAEDAAKNPGGKPALQVMEVIAEWAKRLVDSDAKP